MLTKSKLRRRIAVKSIIPNQRERTGSADAAVELLDDVIIAGESIPVGLFARACGYQVFASGAPVKSR